MSLTFDDGKMDIYPTLKDLEDSVLEIINSIASSLQVRFLILSLISVCVCVCVEKKLPSYYLFIESTDCAVLVDPNFISMCGCLCSR